VTRQQAEDPFSMPVPNGIFADTGAPLPALGADALRGIVDEERLSEPNTAILRQQAKLKLSLEQATFGVIFDVDINDLSSAGWGVLFPSDSDPKIEEALGPLLKHRAVQAQSLFRVFNRAKGYRPGESASDWLARHGTRLEAVDPLLGVPFYLLLVGSPEEIPLEFQYLLDIHWGVGRLHFPTLDEYRLYAESVVAYETATQITRDRSATLFATAHESDRATQLFTSQVALPLTSPSERGVLGARQKFKIDALIGDSATKQALFDQVRGQSSRPSLLLTGSHGLAFKPDDPRQAATQGALLCQDWPGTGPAWPEHRFAAEDVPADAQVHGLILFAFACYSAGWPEHDTFSSDTDRRRIATRASFARLPQTLLAHPNGGALAVIGHVDRAWAYSFQSSRGLPQTQSFRDVLSRLLSGHPIGSATDQFNLRWAGLSAELSDLIREMTFGLKLSESQLASCWVARNDARNYILFGDPAVRLRVDDL
jgi:hypothetical protein